MVRVGRNGPPNREVLTYPVPYRSQTGSLVRHRTSRIEGKQASISPDFFQRNQYRAFGPSPRFVFWTLDLNRTATASIGTPGTRHQLSIHVRWRVHRHRVDLCGFRPKSPFDRNQASGYGPGGRTGSAAVSFGTRFCRRFFWLPLRWRQPSRPIPHAATATWLASNRSRAMRKQKLPSQRAMCWNGCKR